MGKREQRALALCLVLSLILVGLAGLAGDASAVLTAQPLLAPGSTSAPGTGTLSMLAVGLAGLAVHPSLSRANRR